MVLQIKIYEVSSLTGGKGEEAWWQSRRMWAAGLSFAATIGVVAFPDFYEVIIAIGTGIAGILGIVSWNKPKK